MKDAIGTAYKQLRVYINDAYSAHFLQYCDTIMYMVYVVYIRVIYYPSSEDLLEVGVTEAPL